MNDDYIVISGSSSSADIINNAGSPWEEEFEFVKLVNLHAADEASEPNFDNIYKSVALNLESRIEAIKIN